MNAITVSAPGSLMLLGEHAVLHGFRSVVCAIDRRIEITLTPLPDPVLEIESAMGSYSALLLELSADDRFRFILAAVESVRTNIKTGLRITIQAEFDAHVGFGSSAAVTVGVHAALVWHLTGQFPEKRELYLLSLNTVHQVQGCGSGADVAAAVYGGAVGYTIDPSFVPVAWAHPITAVYCGYKKPTPEVIEWVETRFKNDQEQLQTFYEQIHLCAEKGLRALLKNDEETLIQTLSVQQRVMEKMGLSTLELDEIVRAMEADPKIKGVKLSGSGQGDCVIGLGRLSASIGSYEIHELEVDPMGCVQVEIADPK
ncbi:MAG: mevalonate kinase [Pontiellaceae bacterium]